MGQRSIILGGGCFWCVEALYRRMKGVVDLESGYAGGRTKDPTYQQVCTGETGHAEVVKVTYDDTLISTREIVDFFWDAHDPTTLNRQGADIGTQYRSLVIYTDEEQKGIVEASRDAAQQRFSDPIVTEIVADDGVFYPAEDYHQNFYENNPRQGYCRVVIQPKLKKLGFDSASLSTR